MCDILEPCGFAFKSGPGRTCRDTFSVVPVRATIFNVKAGVSWRFCCFFSGSCGRFVLTSSPLTQNQGKLWRIKPFRPSFRFLPRVRIHFSFLFVCWTVNLFKILFKKTPQFLLLFWNNRLFKELSMMSVKSWDLKTSGPIWRPQRPLTSDPFHGEKKVWMCSNSRALQPLSLQCVSQWVFIRAAIVLGQARLQASFTSSALNCQNPAANSPTKTL